MLQIMKASAGSGKTFNLAKKYITLLLKSTDRYAYRHILAVTFTNKATDEMKSRIIKELHKLATEPDKSQYTKDFVPSVFPSEAELMERAGLILSNILHDYSAFAVSTIDRFFQQTLKAFSREIGQFASYQVELDRNSIVAESVDRILDSLTENDSVLLTWLTDNVLEQIEQGGSYKLEKYLMEMAKRLMFPQRKEVMEEVGLDEEKMYSKDNLKKIRKNCRDIKKAFVEQVRDRAAVCVKAIEDSGVSPSESSYKFMEHLYKYAELKDTDVVEMPKDTVINRGPDPELWYSKPKAKKYLPMIQDLLEEPLRDFVACFGRDLQVYNTAVILDSQLYGLGVAGELSKTFEAIMKEKNVLCIDDSNTILKNIIDGSDAPFVYEKIGVRFDHFLLDEFQDTSKVQWQNFSPLLHNSDAGGGENLIVGDVKQSIYRWRGSQWKLLQENIKAEFPKAKEEPLDTNWRSHENVVEFNNLFFEVTADVLDGVRKEGNNTVAEIYKDIHQKVAPKNKGKQGCVQAVFCEPDSQLDRVLETVKDLMSKGASLSEITVLVRSNDQGELVARHLIGNGFAVITDDSLKVKNSSTVRRLVSLMSYVDNPQDKINCYLAESVGVQVPDSYRSLTDLAECLLRSLGEYDEVLHIQAFMDTLQDYVATYGNNLRGFLKAWEEKDPSISSPQSGEAVRVMTIHKSKGLDFPYVILPYVESIGLYKASNYWCRPELASTPLEKESDGVYDVHLSKSSVSTLFANDFKEESLLQQVDNINILYVAMTRAVNGMYMIASHPSAKCLKAISDGDLTQFSNFSQILYWFVSSSAGISGIVRSADVDGTLTFTYGNYVPHCQGTKPNGMSEFKVEKGEEYPSFPVRVPVSLDSVDFFSENRAGVEASNRVRGIVLHDILSGVDCPSDLRSAVDKAVRSGELDSEQGETAFELLSERIAARPEWFPEEDAEVFNESTLIDTDGSDCRPDRVVVKDGKVVIIDYKFGEHKNSYERKMKKYADVWKRMGYEDVSAFLWYLQTGEIRYV